MEGGSCAKNPDNSDTERQSLKQEGLNFPKLYPFIDSVILDFVDHEIVCPDKTGGEMRQSGLRKKMCHNAQKNVQNLKEKKSTKFMQMQKNTQKIQKVAANLQELMRTEFLENLKKMLKKMHKMRITVQ